MLGERVLLRLHMLSTDHVHLEPAHEYLVQRARRLHIAGATVIRGIYGFGRRGLTSQSLWHVSNPVPVILEIVDRPDQIADFLHQEILNRLAHGFITLERAGVLFYRHRASAEPREPLQLLGHIKELSTIPEIDRSLPMKINEDGVLLRVFAGESDMVEGEPLYKAIVHKARELGLAGATVLKGSMGFGANSVLHTSKVLELSTDLPIVIELVDTRENIQKLLPHLDAMVAEGMITMESVRILAYRHNPQ
jgi:uncharacterized protein